jgi:hypothetical protein
MWLEATTVGGVVSESVRQTLMLTVFPSGEVSAAMCLPSGALVTLWSVGYRAKSAAEGAAAEGEAAAMPSRNAAAMLESHLTSFTILPLLLSPSESSLSAVERAQFETLTAFFHIPAKDSSFREDVMAGFATDRG